MQVLQPIVSSLRQSFFFPKKTLYYKLHHILWQKGNSYVPCPVANARQEYVPSFPYLPRIRLPQLSKESLWLYLHTLYYPSSDRPTTNNPTDWNLSFVRLHRRFSEYPPRLPAISVHSAYVVLPAECVEGYTKVKDDLSFVQIQTMLIIFRSGIELFVSWYLLLFHFTVQYWLKILLKLHWIPPVAPYSSCARNPLWFSAFH